MANSLDGLHETQQNLEALIAFAQAEGWTVSQSKGGQWVFTKPGRPAIYTRFTTNTRRAPQKARSRLRRVDQRTSQRGLSARGLEGGS